MIKAAIAYLGKNTGKKLAELRIKRNQNSGGKERLKNDNEFRIHINISEFHQRGEIRRNERYQELEKKYNIKKVDKNDDRRAETSTICTNSKA